MSSGTWVPVMLVRILRPRDGVAQSRYAAPFSVACAGIASGTNRWRRTRLREQEMNAAGDAAETVTVPVACSLSSGDVRTRLLEWDELLRGVSARQSVEGGLRLVFGSSASLTAIADLAIREHACCPFLHFTLGLDAEAPILEVRAPAEAQDVIREVLGGS